MVKPVAAVLARYSNQTLWPLCNKHYSKMVTMATSLYQARYLEGQLLEEVEQKDNQLALPNCLLVIMGYFLIVATMVAILVIITNKITRSMAKV